MTQQGDQAKDLLHFFCRHLVALCGRYKYIGPDEKLTKKETPYCYTGCVITLYEEWFIATAGHCLQNLKEAALNPSVRITEQTLVDYAGAGATFPQPIPFNPLDYPNYYLDDEQLGVDFCLIHLRSLFRDTLKTNWIEPFGPKQWMFPDDLRFDGHCLAGFPQEYTGAERSQDGRILHGLIKPTLVFLRQVPDDSQTATPRFKADIVEMGSQRSIVGMSGGPIFGYYQQGNDTHYHLVALQSRVSADKKSVYGCPVAEFIRRAVETTREDSDGEQTLP